MKPYERIIWITAILAIGIIWKIEHTTNQGNEKAREAEYKAAEREQKDRYRRLEINYELRGDSIQTAFNTIRLAHSETEKAKEKEREAVRRYKDVKFVRYETDSARNKALSKLYKTY